MGVGLSGGTTPPLSTFWGNATAAGNTEAALEYNYMTAPVSCGDIITIQADCDRLTVYTYIEEIDLWDGVNPGSRVSVANWTGLGVSPAWLGWWTPPQAGPINTLTYNVTSADAGKYVIFKYGHGSSWSETADVTFSVTPVTVPIITQQPAEPLTNLVRTAGETLSLTTTALGCDPTYQWLKDGSPLTGQTGTNLTVPNLTAGDAGAYSCAITNGAYSTNTFVVSLSIEPKVSTSASASFGLNFGDEAPNNPTVTTVAFGLQPSRWQATPAGNESAPVSGYQDFPLGAGVVGISWSAQNTYSLAANLPAIDNEAAVTYGYLDDGGSGYNVTLYGLTSAVGYTNYVVRLVAATDQVNNTNFLDATITDNSATYPLSYPPSTAIAGGTMAVSAVSPVLNSDYITIAAPPGVVTNRTRSTLAGFIITDKPVLLTQPQQFPAGALYAGSAITLTGDDAFGVPPLAYQWQKDGTNLVGQTTGTYSVGSATTNDSGSYTLTVTNSYGSVTSTPIVLAVSGFFPPVIGTPPQNRTAYVGGMASFSVGATGGGLAYQWKKGTLAGTDIANQTNTTLLLSGPLAAEDDSDYTVVVMNSVGTNSATAHLTVLPLPATSTELGAVLADSPVALWQLGESAGPTAVDSWGAKDGSYSGAITMGVPGLTGTADTAVTFNGGAVTVPYSASINPSTFTIEFWCRPTANQTYLLALQDRSTGTRIGYAIEHNNFSSGWDFTFGSGASYQNISSAAAIVSGQLYHVVATHDGTTARLYVNGVLVNSMVANYVPAVDTTLALTFGSRNGGTPASGDTMQNIAFYNYALTPAQVQNHTLKVTPLQIAMTPATGIVLDSKPVGTLFNGQNSGTTWVASDTDANGSNHVGVAQFTATNNTAITVTGNPVLDSTNGTISFWVRSVGNTGSGNEAAMIFDRRSTGGGGSGTILAIKDADGTVFFQANPSGANAFSSATAVNDGNWHHVAVTYGQNIGDSVSIYIDGVLNASQANNLAWNWPAEMNIMLGVSRDSYWKKLDGSLDDFRMYDRILNDTEIGQIYTNALVDTAALKLRLNFNAAPVSGYSLTSTPISGVPQVSTNLPTFNDLSGALTPYLHVPTGDKQFYRVRLP